MCTSPIPQHSREVVSCERSWESSAMNEVTLTIWSDYV